MQIPTRPMKEYDFVNGGRLNAPATGPDWNNRGRAASVTFPVPTPPPKFSLFFTHLRQNSLFVSVLFKLINQLFCLHAYAHSPLHPDWFVWNIYVFNQRRSFPWFNRSDVTCHVNYSHTFSKNFTKTRKSIKSTNLRIWLILKLCPDVLKELLRRHSIWWLERRTFRTVNCLLCLCNGFLRTQKTMV